MSNDKAKKCPNCGHDDRHNSIGCMFTKDGAVFCACESTGIASESGQQIAKAMSGAGIINSNIDPTPQVETSQAFEDTLDKAMRQVAEQGYLNMFYEPVLAAHNSAVAKAVLSELERIKGKHVELLDEILGIRLDAVGIGHINQAIAKYKDNSNE